MSADPHPRPDLSALRIEREPEKEQSSIPIGRILGWLFFFIALIAVGVFVYNRWILPGRASLVETLVLKPTVNINNPPAGRDRLSRRRQAVEDHAEDPITQALREI